jgi:endonuclease/exonuclease/phosphatase family metal-dependent hydrolase
VALVVRTWNLFHGNAQRPERRLFLREMLRLVTADGPDVVCLQELPAWALAEVAGWTPMRVVADVAQPPTVGPLPSTAAVGRALTSLNRPLFRSYFAGQANAILVAPAHRVLATDLLVLNARRFRRRQASWLGLGPVARLAWGRERRVCQAARIRLADGRVLLAVNLHATSYPADRRLADAELLRAAIFADALAAPTDMCILAGDFNVRGDESRTLADLATADWGFSPPGAGIDHVLVRGAAATEPQSWPEQRRELEGRLLSDHAPVEVRVE